MNKQIRKLAEKANIEFTYDPTETPVRAFAECWEDDLEKFAELIVRECADRATWAQDTGESDIGGEVLKHFGVEE
jgi:hypothetical protein